jgi:hypothetical protein
VNIGRNLNLYASLLERPAQVFGTIAGPVVQFGKFDEVARANGANPTGGPLPS